MEITLQFVNENNEVEQKDYDTPFVNSAVMLDYYDFDETIEDANNLKSSEVKKYAELIVRGFNNQFTVEELLTGVPSYQLMPLIRQFIAFLNTNPYNRGKNDDASGKTQKAAN